MPPLSSDLETFRDDLYSGRGYEHTPIAKYIIKLLGVYVRRRAEDSLYDPTLPLPIPLLYLAHPRSPVRYGAIIMPLPGLYADAAFGS